MLKSGVFNLCTEKSKVQAFVKFVDSVRCGECHPANADQSTEWRGGSGFIPSFDLSRSV